FFQAEDGIRDFHVTGVQTCALPIYLVASPRHSGRTPLASGSRLPVCPPLLALNSQRTFCRAALELMPSGLSKIRMPSISRRLLRGADTAIPRHPWHGGDPRPPPARSATTDAHRGARSRRRRNATAEWCAVSSPARAALAGNPKHP